MNQHPLRFLVCCLSAILLCLLLSPRQASFSESSPARSATVQQPANLDFEQGAVGQVPTGWHAPTLATFAVELTEENPKSGKRAALIRSVAGATAASPEFGNLMQSFAAQPFRGRRVRFRAAVRMEASEPGARAQLWMRVDRGENRMGFFDNMDDRPITSGEWRYYEIIGDVDEDALAINIGMLLLGKGKAWLDDVSFEDLGKTVILAEPARPLTKQGLENLVAFTRLLGYVRHFHPSDEAAAADWHAFAVDAVRGVEDAKNAADLAQKLEGIFRPIAPTVRVFSDNARPRLPDELRPPKDETDLKIISWRHKGFGQKASNSPYQSERLVKDAPGGKIPENSADPKKPFSASLGGGVSALVPLALFADAKGTLPHAASPTTTATAVPVKYSGNDRATRVADVALAWNIFQHFYPYFDVVKTDWQKALREALASAANDPNERAFLDTLRRLVAQLHDGHGGVYHSSALASSTVPALFGWVEEHLVVTDVMAEGANGLQPGDLVLKVDGRPSVEVLAEREALISGATSQWRRYSALTYGWMGAKDSEITLEVQTQDGPARSVRLRRTIQVQTLKETRPPKIHELKPGVFYLDLERITDPDLQAVLPQLEKATGIVFDLRGYPRVSPMLISHLIDKPVQSARWLVPIITMPDQQNLTEYDTGGRWTLEPIATRLKAKTAFLIDGRAISYAESFMGIIEAYKLAEIVGTPTAGTNGNINPFILPGGYQVIWTGMKVLKHDGSQHHGIGIQPTVSVPRTIRGVREKRDEQLERAFAIVAPGLTVVNPSAAAPQRAGEEKAAAPHQAEREKLAYSRQSQIQTAITFLNGSGQVRRVYWLDYSGERVFYRELQPGESYEQQTFLTHPWLITDAQGNGLAVYYPDSAPRVIQLK
jgi:C-terminal processing protease CtpA/Prc